MKKKWIAALMAVVLLLQVLLPSGVLADQSLPKKGNSDPVFPPGGAAYDPTIPIPLEELKALQEKLVLMEKIRKLVDAGYSVAEIRSIMHMPGLFPYAKGSTIASRSDDSAWCYMRIWKEPEDQPNWCGPGSGKAVLSNWKIPPSMAYLANDAPRPCHPQYDGNKTHCYGMYIPSIRKTLATDWTYIVNHQIGYTWYAMTNPNGLSAYKSYLEMDISWYGHPVNNVVNTIRLPGWGTYRTYHYVAANQYIFSSDLIHYGDTAPNSASPNGDPFGWHWVSLSMFYNRNVVGAYNLIIW